MQTYIDTVKNPVQTPISLALVKSKKQSFKARFPELYFGKSYLDCYWFCQQCKDYFDTIRATGNNYTLIAAFFLWDGINTY